MGIDARIEMELEICVAKLLDPHNLVNWLHVLQLSSQLVAPVHRPIRRHSV